MTRKLHVLRTCEDCTSRERRARVWVWCAHLMGHEADAIFYHRDMLEKARRANELDMLETARRAFVEKADAVSPGYTDRAWGEALDAFACATLEGLEP